MKLALCAASLLALLGDDLDALAKRVKDPSEKERRGAVEELAKIGSVPAWDLVLHALEDTSPMVADEAQLALGGIKDAAALKLVYGKQGLAAGEEWIRLRAAEALGRVKIPVDSGELGRRLGDKSADVRRMTAWSIERLAQQNGLDPKAKKFLFDSADAARKKDKDEGVRAALLLALAQLGADTRTSWSLEATKDGSNPATCVALQLAAKQDILGFIDLFAVELISPVLAVRRQSVLLLPEIPNRRGAALLVKALGDEKNARLSWTIADELEALSGRRNGRKLDAWKEWLGTLPEDWKPPAAPKKEGREVKAPRTGDKRDEHEYDKSTAVFAGMPVLSDHVAILVDMSGSLWEKREDGKTRKELVDKELERTLGAFTKDTHFNLIPYTKDPTPFEKALVPGTPANVKKALDFFVALKESGKGNVWSAFDLAFADAEVDTILVMSDGAPTGGHRWNLELMTELFFERNRFRHIVLDAVIVDAKPGIQEHWKTMCEQNSGRMLPIELK